MFSRGCFLHATVSTYVYCRVEFVAVGRYIEFHIANPNFKGSFERGVVSTTSKLRGLGKCRIETYMRGRASSELESS